MQDPKAYAQNIQKLREYLLRSAGLATLEFPEKLNPKSTFAKMGPTTLDNHVLKGLAETMNVALEAFNDVQLSMGLSRYDPAPRFDGLKVGTPKGTKTTAKQRKGK
jgi:hypothetical protein